MADKNIDDLMAAAKLKLEAQKQEEEKAQQQTSNGEDIYAEMKDEMGDDSFPEYNIQHTMSSPAAENIPHIKNNGTPEPDYFIDPNDTPIFPDGPGQSEVDIWKKQFTHEKVFHTQILERHFVFRTLNRFEYKQIVAIENIDALYREEMICRTCVLWPRNYDFKEMAVEDSGYPSTLAQIIMENSGFTQQYGIEVL